MSLNKEILMMKSARILFSVAASVVFAASLGCAHNYGPPPPPPPIGQAPPIVDLADHNGFETGRADGARDSINGLRYGARRTRAYHDTPGYDPHLGPFHVYQNAFRNAYLRGYDRGYNRR
jgi:hypothetical protein